MPDDAAAQLRIENLHLIDANSVAGRQQDMIDTARAAVRRQDDTIAGPARFKDACFFEARNILQARSQPQDRSGKQAMLVEPVAGARRQTGG